MFDFSFNNVEEVSSIPENTIVKVRLTLRPRDIQDEPYLKASKAGEKYLDCEFTVIEGQYMKRKIFHKLGVKGNEQLVKMSHRLIKNLIESASGIARNDKSSEAEAKRQITSFADLDGLEVLVKVWIEKSEECADKRVIEQARKKIQQDQINKYDSVSQSCSKYWPTMPLVNKHPYLTKKQIKSHGLRGYTDKIAILLQDISGKMCSF